jgi:hypothetical protein
VLPRVLILDQFEEIFRVPPEHRETARLLSGTRAALNNDRQLRLLLFCAKISSPSWNRTSSFFPSGGPALSP